MDYRIYDKARDGKTKNDHFRELLDRSYAWGFAPECVLFDSWYSSLENLKAVRSYGWAWLTRLERNRIRTGMSWWEAKTSIVREAVRSYLAAPRFTLGATA